MCYLLQRRSTFSMIIFKSLLTWCWLLLWTSNFSWIRKLVQLWACSSVRAHVPIMAITNFFYVLEHQSRTTIPVCLNISCSSALFFNCFPWYIKYVFHVIVVFVTVWLNSPGAYIALPFSVELLMLYISHWWFCAFCYLFLVSNVVRSNLLFLL